MDIVSRVFAGESEALIRQLGEKLGTGKALGSFSVSIYDTAWLARIRDKRGNEPKWLFPQCFEYLLRTQSSDGDWFVPASDLDGILNTMVALVALKEHQAQPELSNEPYSVQLGERVRNAEDCLRSRLQNWDVASNVHVATEIIIPALLKDLESDGSNFEFPGREVLLSLNERKLRKFRPEMLYSPTTTTAVYSLEALVGRIDYDRVSHHLDERGSMLGSPASTAAYLMYRSTWDDAAQAYLQNVVTHGSGKGNGGVPGAFPSSTFELTWIMSTLLQAQSSSEVLQIQETVRIREFLQSQFHLHEGLLGFESGLLNDSDDTAKAILSLNLLGFAASPQRMVEEFEAAEHFRTYKLEGNGSFSANCNVLNALLHCGSPGQYVSQILKVSRFLCREFNLGKIRDKWNLCEGYSEMLLVESFVKLLRSWDGDLLGEMPQDLVSEQIPIVLVQIALQTLQRQFADGSWCFNTASREVTAYAVLTLKRLASLPWLRSFQSQIQAAIGRGSTYLLLSHDQWDQDEYLWISKVTYALPPVARAYKIAALCANTTHQWSDKVVQLATVPREQLGRMARFFSALPMFCDEDLWLIEGDVTLGYLYRHQLLRASSDIFPSREKTDDKYLAYIPFTWIAMNRKNHQAVSNVILWEMMIISLLVYRLDEFMETIFSSNSKPEEFEQVQQIIRELCESCEKGLNVTDPRNGLNGHSTAQPVNGEASDTDTRDSTSQSQSRGAIKSTLNLFTSYILHHSAVTQSPNHVRQQLRDEVSRCMIAHVRHEEDNQCFVAQRRPHESIESPSPDIAAFTSAKSSYYSWVRTVASANTQSPSIFLLFSCLVATPGESFFLGARQNYLASALSGHLASLCRLYNDHGSVKRDQAEGNLNSLNFPEFHEIKNAQQAKSSEMNGSSTSVLDVKPMKDDLLSIAEFERECLNLVTEKLERELRGSPAGNYKVNALRLFIGTVDLWGQVYVAKDISNRLR